MHSPHLFHLCARTGRAVGACNSGSIAHPKDATRPASDGAATTSTPASPNPKARQKTAALEQPKMFGNMRRSTNQRERGAGKRTERNISRLCEARYRGLREREGIDERQHSC